jgi:uncharacterized protein (TIGR04222 family)
MDFLLHNPIADVSGPAFLLVYALVAAAVVVASRLQISAADTSGALQLPGVAVDRDPYEVAYLRGGGNELLRFAIFDLTRVGFLRVAEPVKKGKAPSQIVQTGQAGADALSSLQRTVIAFYAQPHTAPELFASAVPAAAAAFGDAAFKARLEGERFYTAPEVRTTAMLARLYGALALTAFSAYRFWTASLNNHRNVIFLAIETVAALVILVLATRVPRLSRRARSYLQRLATALRPMQVAPVVAGGAALPILVAATGLAALAGTEYAPMTDLFPQRATSGGSGCSGGCGGGSGGGDGGGDGGGSGCGGGCGG